MLNILYALYPSDTEWFSPQNGNFIIIELTHTHTYNMSFFHNTYTHIQYVYLCHKGYSSVEIYLVFVSTTHPPSLVLASRLVFSRALMDLPGMLR